VKALFLCGSPKGASGASYLMLEAVRKASGGGPAAFLKDGSPPEPGGWEGLLSQDALILSFPLYVDLFPDPLLAFLETLSAEARQWSAASPGRALPVLYAIVNNGFFEARHCALAAESLRLFCRDSGLAWGGALMAGGGPMASSSPGLFRLGFWPFGRLKRALRAFGKKTRNLEKTGDVFLNLPMPKGLYILMANSYWRLLAFRSRTPQKSLCGPALEPAEIASSAGEKAGENGDAP
jgi:hypothetical protein